MEFKCRGPFIILIAVDGVSFLNEEIIARALMDTGASVNVMKERLWEKLGKPALLEAPPTLFAANRSHIEVVGKSSPLKTTMGIKDEMYVSYVIIPTEDRDQIILGRQFMTKYHVLVDLVRREARSYLPDGGSPSLDVIQIDDAGERTPVTLEEFVTEEMS